MLLAKIAIDIGYRFSNNRRDSSRTSRTARQDQRWTLLVIRSATKMPTRTAVWPLELLSDPRPNERGPNQLRCFLICPFPPKEVYDDLTRIVRDACNGVGTNLHCTLECIREIGRASCRERV